MDDLWGWLVPALVVFGGAGVLLALIVTVVRALRRGPRARAIADAERTTAGVLLVELDEAVQELELETGLSTAMYDGEVSTRLRRARMRAQHARDDAFADFARIADEGGLPAERRAVARSVQHRCRAAMRGISAARSDHTEWLERHSEAPRQLAAARERLTVLRRDSGDPGTLLAELQNAFDPEEWQEAARAADAAADGFARAEAALAEAERGVDDPTRSILSSLSRAERALRDAEQATGRLEDAHRRIVQAARAVQEEITSTEEAVRQAVSMRPELEPDAGDALAAQAREAESAIARARSLAADRPTAAIDLLARTRDGLDFALGDARSAQQRLRAARSALPSTFAAARNAIAHAHEAVSRPGTGADARVRLSAASEALAAARQARDPVVSLDTARRAIRHAEDAKALADHDRLR